MIQTISRTKPPNFLPQYKMAAVGLQWNTLTLYLKRRDTEGLFNQSWELPSIRLGISESPESGILRTDIVTSIVLPKKEYMYTTWYVQNGSRKFLLYIAWIELTAKNPPRIEVDSQEYIRHEWRSHFPGLIRYTPSIEELLSGRTH